MSRSPVGQLRETESLATGVIPVRRALRTPPTIEAIKQMAPDRFPALRAAELATDDYSDGLKLA